MKKGLDLLLAGLVTAMPVANANAGIISDLQKCVYPGYVSRVPQESLYCHKKIKNKYRTRSIRRTLEENENTYYIVLGKGIAGNNRESYFAAPILEKKIVDGATIYHVDSRNESKSVLSYKDKHQDTYFVNKIGRMKNGKLIYEIVIDVKSADELARDIVKNWERKYVNHKGNFDRKMTYNDFKHAARKGKRELYKEAYNTFLKILEWHELGHIKANQKYQVGKGHNSLPGETFALIHEFRASGVAGERISNKAKVRNSNRPHAKASRIILGGFLSSKKIRSLNDVTRMSDKMRNQRLRFIERLLARDFEKYSKRFLKHYYRSRH